MSAWIKCSDQMPEIDYSGPKYAWNVRVLAAEDGHVAEMSWSSNGYAKTEKGRAPRWECGGKIPYMEPTHWQPLPDPPGESE